MQQAVQLLEKTFIQRNDMFASQLDDGRYIAIKESLSHRHLELHLMGHITLGTYLLTVESTTCLMVLDADQENGLADLSNLSYELEKEEIPTYLESSRRGGHLWFFFDQPLEGDRVRNFGWGVIRRHKLHGVELYPKQDRLHGGPGSLVRLPFGIHKRSGRRYPFINRDGSMIASTVREQIQLLSNHKNVPQRALDEYTTRISEKRPNYPYKVSGTIYGSSEVERIKSKVPLMDFLSGFVDLRPTANGAVGLCPFHDDEHPSFSVNIEENYWHCFAGCGGGSIIDFWMKWNNCDIYTATKELAEMLGVADDSG